MSLYRVEQELKNRSTLLGAGGHHCPDSFTPSAAFFASRSLRGVPVNHDKANRLLGQIVRRSRCPAS